jgi:hypothetical protein
MISFRVAERWANSEGGKSPSTVKLVDVEMTDDGVLQKWGVYSNGQKILVKTVTDDNGKSVVSGNDVELGFGVSAQQAVAFILNGAHPSYYPKPGQTITLDDKFLKQVPRKL